MNRVCGSYQLSHTYDRDLHGPGRAGPRFGSGKRAGPGHALHGPGRVGPCATGRAQQVAGKLFLWANFYFLYDSHLLAHATSRFLLMLPS